MPFCAMKRISSPSATGVRSAPAAPVTIWIERHADVAFARQARLRAARQARDVVAVDAQAHAHAALDQLDLPHRAHRHAVQAHRHALVDAGGVGGVEVDVGVLHEHALLVGHQADQRRRSRTSAVSRNTLTCLRMPRKRRGALHSVVLRSSIVLLTPPAAHRSRPGSARGRPRRSARCAGAWSARGRRPGSRPPAARGFSSSARTYAAQALLVQRHVLGQLGEQVVVDAAELVEQLAHLVRAAAAGCRGEW